jgi:CubicO group peptidase (beta-lactamase class C family)
MLTHTSGLANYYLLENDISRSYLPVDRAELYSYLQGNGFQAKPGTSFNYSNANYTLGAFLIESVTGLSFDCYMDQYIFGPLSMINSGDNTRDDIAGHMISTQGLTPADDVHPTLLPGSASLYASARDLYLWDRALYTDVLINQSQLDKMFTRHVESYFFQTERDWYGYGWFIRDVKIQGATRLNQIHTGNLDTSHTVISRYPDDDAVIIILADVGTNYLLSALSVVETILFEEGD